jgi:hypothetical protein
MPAFLRLPARVPLCLTYLGALALACSSAGITVKGKVVKNGRPLELKSDTLIIFFVTTHEGEALRSMALFKPADGTFLCDGPTGRGIPEGTYRIELHPASADFPPNIDRFFHGEFLGAKSPLKITLTRSNSQDVVVDVGTKTVIAQ